MSSESIPIHFHNRSPQTAVFIGPAPAADEAASEFSKQHKKTKIVRIEAEAPIEILAKTNRYDLAVVIDQLEFSDKTSAGNLIAALRDRYAKSLIVVVRLGATWEGLKSHWQTNDLFAYGMKRLALHEQDGKSIGVFEFNIHDYKIKPTWLNPKHWAHPERWDDSN